MERAGKIFRENAKINIIIIPNHQTGMLLLKTAKIEFALSNFDSARLAKNIPNKIPIITITSVEVVKSKRVFGIFSIIISFTDDDPESLTKKLDLPRSNIITLNKVFRNRFGEYHGSSNPKFFI